LFHHR
jgi:hypothetical protein